jgi:hypothetical protein
LITGLLLTKGGFCVADQEKLDGLLLQASEKGHTETVKLLLDADADVHALDDKALWLASYGGHAETVKLLLDAGADVHARDDGALLPWCAGETGRRWLLRLTNGT